MYDLVQTIFRSLSRRTSNFFRDNYFRSPSCRPALYHSIRGFSWHPSLCNERVVGERERDHREASPKGPPVAIATLEQPLISIPTFHRISSRENTIYSTPESLVSCLLGTGKRETGRVSILDTVTRNKCAQKRWINATKKFLRGARQK